MEPAQHALRRSRMIVLNKVRRQAQLAKLVSPECLHEKSALVPIHLWDHHHNIVQVHRLNAECHEMHASFLVPAFQYTLRQAGGTLHKKRRNLGSIVPSVHSAARPSPSMNQNVLKGAAVG